MTAFPGPDYKNAIAITGMSCRFPGATDPQTFWENIRDGIESVSFFSREELRAAGVPDHLLNRPDYVRAKGMLAGIEDFDASFFGLSAREARGMDPRHRLFLECAREAVEQSGYDPGKYPGRIGVFAGAGPGNYLEQHPRPDREFTEEPGPDQTPAGNSPDFLPRRVSHLLRLTGPSLNIGGSCATSLTAVQLACQSLLACQCDMALAGAAQISLPRQEGYLHQPGLVFSPDGDCRAFDARAEGFATGNGVGVVLLKRLEDALAGRDTILALILGAAINHDSGGKAGFAAPGPGGQAEAAAEALALAGVDPETVTFMEVNGTGTLPGYLMEITALTRVFRAGTGRTGFCALGSVKTNVGHLGQAAGLAGLIKTVQALRHRQLPPLLHFQQPDAQIDFTGSPFYTVTRPTNWQTAGFPRRAGVHSFGTDGTNAHLVLEEAPPPGEGGPARPWQLLPLSARDEQALAQAAQRLANHLAAHPEQNLADIAFTLSTGRKAFEYRRHILARTAGEARTQLTRPPAPSVIHPLRGATPPVVFLFPGQGSQHVNMGKELYLHEPIFREELNRCRDRLTPLAGFDILDLLYPASGEDDATRHRLNQTGTAQPALFALEYALARWWMNLGVVPRALLGHSFGEYTAACLAGVLSLEDASELIVVRGRLMQQLPPGAMLSVQLTEAELEPLLRNGLSLAAVNGARLCTASGPPSAIERLESDLTARGVTCRRLHTSHAFHSGMMDPVLNAVTATAARLRLRPPALPFISSLTGTWITPAQATDPAYWAQQMRQPVRFSIGLETVLQDPGVVLLETGPGQTLTALVRTHPGRRPDQTVVPSMRHPKEARSDQAALLDALGQLWTAGLTVDWTRYYAGEVRQRVPLPTYPFQRQRYRVDPPDQPRPETVPPFAGPGSDHATETVCSSGPPPIALQEPAMADTGPAERPPVPQARPRPALRVEFIPPRNETEAKLAALWADALGIDQAGVFDDFFESGGHSLLAVSLFTQIHQVFQRRLQISVLFEAPTISQLAELLQPAGTDTGPASTPATGEGPATGGRLQLTVLTGAGTRPPLILIHNMSGEIVNFRELARWLQPEYPVLAMAAPFRNGEYLSFASIPEMAAAYAEPVQRARPDGPLFLFGQSSGGIVALEMARQLHAAGREIALVGLLDTRLPGLALRHQPLSRPGYLRDFLRQAARWLQYAGTSQARRRQLRGNIRARLAGRQPPAWYEKLDPVQVRFIKAHKQILQEHRPESWPGRTALFRTKAQALFNDPAPDLGWNRYITRGVEVYYVPGVHDSMMDDCHAPALAGVIKTALAKP